jgi:hypothetical protein
MHNSSTANAAGGSPPEMNATPSTPQHIWGAWIGIDVKRDNWMNGLGAHGVLEGWRLPSRRTRRRPPHGNGSSHHHRARSGGGSNGIWRKETRGKRTWDRSKLNLGARAQSSTHLLAGASLMLMVFFLFYSSFLKLLDLSQRGMDKWWIDNDARYKDLFHKDESSYDFIFGRHLRVGSIPVRMFQKLISVWKAHQYNYNFVRTTKSPKPCDHWVSHRKWKCVWYWQYCRPLQICNVVVPCLLSDLSGHSCRW